MRNLLAKCKSFYNTAQEEPEKVYHAFVLGLLITLSKTHEVKSNRESVFGRYDVCLIPKDPSSLGVVIEFKKVDEKEDLEKGAEDALKQILGFDFTIRKCLILICVTLYILDSF